MLDYLRAKAADYAVVLSWADQELKRIQSTRLGRQPLLAQLQNSLHEAQDLLNSLQIISRIGHPRLYTRALPIIHQIEFWTIIITYYYLPALQRESHEDLVLRDILIPAAKRGGLTWIEDLVVRLDGAYGTVSVLTETPIVFGPPQQSATLLDMAGMYHEFGHTAFRKFPSIADQLSASVSVYYSEFLQSAGPLTPDKRTERERAIGKALEYWDEKRLEELFCDIYAVFVIGPAYYFSCVDMAVRSILEPFHVDIRDEHPPMAARVYVCQRALTPAHRKSQVVRTARDTWNAHTNSLSENAEFLLYCASALLDHLADVAIREIEQLLPGAWRYDNQRFSEDRRVPPDKEALEHILNLSAMLLVTDPHRYADWDRRTLEDLKG